MAKLTYHILPGQEPLESNLWLQITPETEVMVSSHWSASSEAANVIGQLWY